MIYAAAATPDRVYYQASGWDAGGAWTSGNFTRTLGPSLTLGAPSVLPGRGTAPLASAARALALGDGGATLYDRGVSVRQVAASMPYALSGPWIMDDKSLRSVDGAVVLDLAPYEDNSGMVGSWEAGWSWRRSYVN
ncbi:MAG: hypothetical protein LBH76_03945 [Propionibacteriaceae bacterium]|jgi:hypothetical protein|nr:hypothetical protein [Propionibacteriaceae bacterium]